MYRVIKSFNDLQDGGHAYKVGDQFPHGNKRVLDSRIAELSSNKNRRGVPLIEYIEDVLPLTEETPKEQETNENTPIIAEAEEKPKRGKRKNARTDS